MRDRPGVRLESPGMPRAAVAVIVRVDRDDLRLLLIKRVERAGDPWSGQMAFPGGRYELVDADLLDTAARETWEETGVALRRHKILGALDDAVPRNVPVCVTPYVTVLDGEVPIKPSSEVSGVVWVPFSFLEHPVRSRIYIRRGRKRVGLEAYVYEGYMIWGMTLRVIKGLLRRIRRARAGRS